MLTLVQNMGVAKRNYALPRPWESAIQGWLAWQELGGISPATIRLRREHIRAIAHRSHVEHPRLLTLRVIVTQCNRPWSKEHRKAVRRSLVSFCEWCCLNGFMDDNPALHLPRVLPSSPRPRPTPDEVWRNLMASCPPRELLMIRLAGEAGLRRAEVAHAHCDDLVRDGSGWALIVRGKGDKQRVVPVTDSLAATIRTHCERGYLFPGPTGGHLGAKYVGALVSELMPHGWSMHSLRHRFATRGYAGTGNLRAVQEALGHASVATTQRYTAVSSRDVRSVAEAAGGPDVA